LPRPERPEVRLALDLACCVTRARWASKKPVDSSNDVYWHTREACVALVRASGFLTQDLIRLLSQADGMRDTDVLERSSQLWPQVAHPLVLAHEVMES
jgi:hypothetical protein